MSKRVSALLCGVALLAGIILIALVKTSTPSPSVEAKPWFDAKLREFFALKAQQAAALAVTYEVKPHRQVWEYLEAGKKGEWRRASVLWKKVRKRSHQYPDSRPEKAVSVVWSPVMETNLALDQLSCWDEKYVRFFTDEIIKSIPPGSIYFGGTDPGRGLITVWCKAQIIGDPFFVLTQNALLDGTYINYLRFTYKTKIAIPTDLEIQKALSDYMGAVANRYKLNNLKPGEQVSFDENGRVALYGETAVMEANSLLLQTIFEDNSDREFYIEQSYIFDWLYPRLVPHGLIMKIDRHQLAELPDRLIAEDHAFWSRTIQPMIGNWLNEKTSLTDLFAFSEIVFLYNNCGAYNADPAFVSSACTHQTFSKLRHSIARMYAWRAEHSTEETAKIRFEKEADFAYRQALALCPYFRETVWNYALFLNAHQRRLDATLLVKTALRMPQLDQTARSYYQNLATWLEAQN